MSKRTPREKFLAQLKKKMLHGTTASERLQATKMYGEMTYGLTPDGKFTGDSVPLTPDGSIQLPPLRPVPPKKLSDFEEVAQYLPDVSPFRRIAKILADEACDFVLWRQGMGEDDGAATWGDWQRAYTINLHQKHLDSALQVTAMLNSNSVSAPHEWDRLFTFERGGRYPQEILNRARVELNV